MMDTGYIPATILEKHPHEQWLKIKRTSLLLADPDRHHRVFSRQLLSDIFEVHEADNGFDALKKAEKLNPSAIISNIHMPLMNGLELCMAIRKHRLVGSIPIIIMAEKSKNKSQLACYKAGADLFLTKPLKRDLIIHVIVNYLLKKEKIKRSLLAQMPSRGHDHSSTIMLYDKDKAFLTELTTSLETCISNPHIDAQYLCKTLAISRTALYNRIKKLTGKSVHEFIKFIRLKNSLKHLIEGRLSICQIAFEVGFNSHSYYDKCFIQQFGITPKEYIRKYSAS